MSGSLRSVGAMCADTCYHCGATNPPATRWRRSVGGVRQAFCCAGCLAVTEAIDTAGLQSFYARRDAPAAERPLDRSVERWRRIAADANAERLVRISGESCEIALLIDGMTCGACVWLIERWLSRRPGIVAVSVNFATRRARVVWNPAATDLATVLAAIEAIGYGAHPYDPARRETLARKESRLALARAAVALLAMMQVMMFAAPAYLDAADVAGGTAAIVELGIADVDPARDAFLGCAVLSRRLARSAQPRQANDRVSAVSPIARPAFSCSRCFRVALRMARSSCLLSDSVHCRICWVPLTCLRAFAHGLEARRDESSRHPSSADLRSTESTARCS